MSNKKANKEELSDIEQGFTEHFEEGREGNVLIFEEEGETIDGIFLGKGRNIGEGQFEIETWSLHELETDMIQLLPNTSVLESAIKRFCDARKDSKGHFVIRVTYKGKKQNRKGTNSYHDWVVQSRPATEEEVQRLSVEHQANPVELNRFLV